MKRIISSSLIMILSLYTALASEPDSMYIHLKGEDGVSIVAYALANVDSIVYYASEKSTAPSCDITVTDIDGNVYGAVQIGDQVWMSENLKVSVTKVDTTGGMADGICDVNDVFVWDNTDASYGKLYSWQAAQKACPSGWHLPSDAEWTTLTTYLTSKHPDTEGSVLKSTSGWAFDDEGTDNYGFTALPGGHFFIFDYRNPHNYQRLVGNWWSSTPEGLRTAYRRYMCAGNTDVIRDSKSRYYGHSVRCVRD